MENGMLSKSKDKQFLIIYLVMSKEKLIFVAY